MGRLGSVLGLMAMLVACGSASWAVDLACLDPVVEVRAIWIDAGAIPKTEWGVRELVREYARAGINVLFPETICRGYAVYPSKLLARDPRFVGAPDTLAAMVREAHRLGIEVHPWVWVFRAGYTNDRGAILTAHPDWAERDAAGNELSANGGYWLSPANPAVRDFLADLFAEIVTRYDVDGLHLDYVRYETREAGDYGYSDCAVAEFTRRHGFAPDAESAAAAGAAEVLGGPMLIYKPDWQERWDLFREQQISTFVERIALQTRSIRPPAIDGIRPPLVLSAAVGETPRAARVNLMQNWLNWLDNKWLDFVVPMSYTTDDARFGRLVLLQRNAVGSRSLLVPGIGIHAQGCPEQAVCQIALAREAGADGEALFSASYLTAPHLAALATGPYMPGPAKRAPSLPFRDPAAGSRMLCARAAELCASGQCEEADYFAARAAVLADYASYRECPVPYFPPSPTTESGW